MAGRVGGHALAVAVVPAGLEGKEDGMLVGFQTGKTALGPPVKRCVARVFRPRPIQFPSRTATFALLRVRPTAGLHGRNPGQVFRHRIGRKNGRLHRQQRKVRERKLRGTIGAVN